MLPEVLEQEQKVSEAFSKQSVIFDEEDSKNKILQWMRGRVRQQVISLWKPGDHVLELNAGTGIDAVFFASNGFKVYATDNAPGMLAVLEGKVKNLQISDKITTQLCSFLELENIGNKKFDHIFSNFGGLNCTDKLVDVVKSLDTLLKPGGTVTLVIMPPVCPWELVYILKGNFKLAFRRLKKGGAPSHLEGEHFTTWYYTPAEIKKMFGKNYSVISVTGLGILVPPPFLENFPEKHPKLFRRLAGIESSIASKTLCNSWADHFIICLTKLR